jgi:hypothetical protein
MDPETIDIEDIAHALSLICRFTGHVSEFYSVAEHCVWVSNLAYKYALTGVSGVSVPCNQREAAKIGLHALLHDAAEAYVADLNSPAKSLIPEYKVLEDRIASVIYKKYGVEFDSMPAQVKYADNTMLVAEATALLVETDFSKWVAHHYDADAVYRQIPLTPRQAQATFLTRFATMLQMFLQPPKLEVIDGGKKEEKIDGPIAEQPRGDGGSEESDEGGD